jgi:hypothetical protein
MKCKLCVERGKTWKGDDPVCAFESGTFAVENWNCATMGALRDLCKDSTVYNDDQNAALLCGADYDHIVLLWYKSRGRTEGAYMVKLGIASPLTLKEAENVLIKYLR